MSRTVKFAYSVFFVAFLLWLSETHMFTWCMHFFRINLTRRLGLDHIVSSLWYIAKCSHFPSAKVFFYRFWIQFNKTLWYNLESEFNLELYSGCWHTHPLQHICLFGCLGLLFWIVIFSDVNLRVYCGNCFWLQKP